MTLLLIDSEVFTRFHLHLNPIVWELVINPDQNEMARDWQLMFISVPVILLIEMLFATWSWQNCAVSRAVAISQGRLRHSFSSPLSHRILSTSGQTLILPADYHAAGKPAALLSDDGATFS